MALLMLAATALCAIAENLIVNGGFEVGCEDSPDDIYASRRTTLDEPSHWFPLRYVFLKNMQTTFWDDTIVHSGSRSANLTVTELDPENPNLGRAWETKVDAAGLVGKRLTLRFFMRTEDVSEGGEASGELQCWEAFADWRARDPKGQGRRNMYLGADTESVQGTTDWTEYCVSLVVPEGTAQIIIYLGLTGLGRCWFDDVILQVDDLCASEPAKTYSWLDEEEDRSDGVDRLPVQRNPETVAPAEPAGVKPWTILLYDDAEFPGFNPIEEFAAEAQSTENVHVVVFEDTPTDGARTWLVDREDDQAVLTCVAENGEPDMADGETLQGILEYVKTWYPSDRLMLMIYDHGHGWWGACRDHTNNPDPEDWRLRDWLTPMEMADSLAATGGVDALLFTAPCLMGALETAYEVREQTPLYIGSQENSGYVLWSGTIGGIVDLLTAQPGLDITRIGRAIIEQILTFNEEEESGMPDLWNRTISAVAANRTGALAAAIDRLAVELIDAMDASSAEIRQAREAVQSFGVNEMIDLVDFAQECAARIPALNDASIEVQRAAFQCVLSSLWDSKHPEAHGLTLHFPYPDPENLEMTEMLYAVTGETYRTYGLSFVEDTHWDEFLDAFFEAVPEAAGWDKE